MDVSKNVEKYRDLMYAAYRQIWTHPETGYREWGTHAFLKGEFEKLGYKVTEAGDIPGFYTDIDTGIPGPTVLVMGELDALICPNHPEAVNGNAHACGHCAQTAALLGVAAALTEPDALEGLSGRIRLMAVPAEELIEVGYREELRKAGTIRYFGGKPEFLRRGLMDGVDMCMMIHTSSVDPAHTGDVSGGSNGMITFTAEFEGVASHAGGSPDRGINALYAANQALSAINALRETFPDKSHIRVHPIVTEGGGSVNIIPDRVVLESYIRGADMETVRAVSKKVDRALAGSAASIGAKVTIRHRPGYFALNCDPGMMLVMKEAMEEHLKEVYYRPDSWGTGSTDMGDMSAVMPSIHPHIGGASGNGHGADYVISDFDTAVVESAKVQVSFLRILLSNGAARAKKILAEFKPLFDTKEAYFAYMDSLIADVTGVTYNEDGTVTLRVS